MKNDNRESNFVKVEAVVEYYEKKISLYFAVQVIFFSRHNEFSAAEISVLSATSNLVAYIF